MGPKWDFSGPHKHTIDSFEKIVVPPSKLDFFPHKMAHFVCFEICLIELGWKKGDF